MNENDLKIIMRDLTREPRISDDKCKFAYVDGILDFFNKVKLKLEEEIEKMNTEEAIRKSKEI